MMIETTELYCSTSLNYLDLHSRSQSDEKTENICAQSLANFTIKLRMFNIDLSLDAYTPVSFEFSLMTDITTLQILIQI